MPGATGTRTAALTPLALVAPPVTVTTLSSLDARQFYSGMAEVMKYGLIMDASFYEWILSKMYEIHDRDADTLEEMIRTADIGEDTVVYMDIGETEMNWPGARLHFRTFCDLLLKKHVLLTSRIVPGGTHCEASWERQIPFFVPALLY